MSNLYNGSQELSPTLEGGAPLFDATPVWDRPRKRRGMFGGAQTRRAVVTPSAETPASSAVEARADALQASLKPAAAAIGPGFGLGVAPLTAEATEMADTPMAIATGPVVRTRTASKAALNSRFITAGVLGLAVAGGAGWYFTHDNIRAADPAPDQMMVAQAAVESAPPIVAVVPTTAAPTISNSNPSRAVNAPARMATRPELRPNRMRPTTPSAEAAATQASASTALPDGPQPYAADASASQPAATVSPPVTPPIVPQAAPQATEPTLQAPPQ